MDSKHSEKNGIRHRYAWLVLVLAIATIVYLVFAMAAPTRRAGQARLHDATKRPTPANAEQGASDSKPSRDEPTAQTTAAHRLPVPAVEQSDIALAIRQFLSASHCVHARRVAQSFRGYLNACNQGRNHAEFFARCSETSATYRDDIARLERDSAHCEINEAIAEDEYFDAVLKAAKLGNVDAQICFVDSSFHLSMPWSDEARERYRELARTYVDAAIKRGDWRIVQLLGTGFRGFGNRDLLRSVTSGDRLSVYRMNRLKRHGAIGEYARILDLTATNPEAPFAAGDAKAAENWALETYGSYFSQSPLLTEEPTPCAASSRFQ